MRYRICAAACLFVMFLSGCGTVLSPDEWNHFAFSASVASAGTAASSRPVESVGLTMGLGLLKEIYDQLYGTGFQTGDVLADLAGAVTGGYVTAEICMEEYP